MLPFPRALPWAGSNVGLQQLDFIVGQVEQTVDDGVDLGLVALDFGSEAGDFGAFGSGASLPSRNARPAGCRP